jgi:hypothetical protein
MTPDLIRATYQRLTGGLWLDPEEQTFRRFRAGQPQNGRPISAEVIAHAMETIWARKNQEPNKPAAFLFGSVQRFFQDENDMARYLATKTAPLIQRGLSGGDLRELLKSQAARDGLPYGDFPDLINRAIELALPQRQKTPESRA